MYVCSKCDKAIKAPSPVASYEDKYYHPDCLACHACSRSLSGRQFVKEKSGKLVCEECNMKTAPRCHKCRQVFAPGVTYKKISQDIFYHNECFRCVGPCRAPIGADFYELGADKFICTACYDKHGNDYEKFMEEPARAAPPPTASSPSVNLAKLANLSLNEKPAANNNNNNNNHKDINSSNDNRSNNSNNVEKLPAVQREREKSSSSSNNNNNNNNNNDTSNKINNSKPATTTTPTNSKSSSEKSPENERLCAKCNQKLSGTVTTYEKKQYHTKCFVCCQCGDDFKENSFFKLDGQPLCRNCHAKNLVESASRCRKCEQPILDTVVTFKNGEYHDYCLVCSACSNKLVGQSIYTDKQDAPYCMGCFTLKEGKYCGKCTRLIAPSQSNLVFEGKHFHKECFVCNKCGRVISSSESFYKDEAEDGRDLGIICGECVDN